MDSISNWQYHLTYDFYQLKAFHCRIQIHSFLGYAEIPTLVNHDY